MGQIKVAKAFGKYFNETRSVPRIPDIQRGARLYDAVRPL